MPTATIQTPDAWRVFYYGQRVALAHDERVKDQDGMYRFVPAGTVGTVCDSHVLRGGYGFSVYIGNLDACAILRADRINLAGV